MKITKITRKLSNGSEVHDVELKEEPGISRILQQPETFNLHANTEADADALIELLVELIERHTSERVRRQLPLEEA